MTCHYLHTADNFGYYDVSINLVDLWMSELQGFQDDSLEWTSDVIKDKNRACNKDCRSLSQMVPNLYFQCGNGLLMFVSWHGHS